MDFHETFGVFEYTNECIPTSNDMGPLVKCGSEAIVNIDFVHEIANERERVLDGRSRESGQVGIVGERVFPVRVRDSFMAMLNERFTGSVDVVKAVIKFFHQI